MAARIPAYRFVVVTCVLAALLVPPALWLHRKVSSTPSMRTYCAQMPDSIGLYVGSPVTIRGIRQGAVTAVVPDGPTTRVEFEIPADRPLAAGVGATTVSDTLIADRRLELVDASPVDGALPGDGCITRTATPKSLSEMYAAIIQVVDQLGGAETAPENNTVRHALSALDRESRGTGPGLNELILRLGSSLRSPDAAIGHIGEVIDALSELVRSAANGWSDLEAMLPGIASMWHDVNTLALPPIVTTVEKLRDILPPVNDLVVQFGSPLLDSLARQDSVTQLWDADLRLVNQILAKLPALTNLFSRSVEPSTGRISFGYAAPQVAIADLNGGQTCAAINAIAPGHCSAGGNGTANVHLIQLVLAAIGER